MQQGSEEWKQARCGRVTASRVHDIVAVTRSGGYTAGRKNYLAELVCERLTGQPAEHWVSPAMIYGLETEPEARFAYALAKGVEIEEVGFIPHPTIEMAGASPDGMVGKDGLVEIKCPNTATHIETLLGATRGGGLMPGYSDQMQFQMACTGRKWCDFVSYDKRLPEPMRISVYRLNRDDERIAELEQEVVQFLIDLNATVDLLRKRYMQEAA
jgi:putative phage-type endonuclease